MDAKQLARYAALSAIFLIPFTPLFVANSLFFPFITGKAFYFRILTEVAFAAWVVLALADSRYRPRFSWIEIAVFAFIGWMFIANLFALNVEKAFWSNFERMEGWVLLAHLGMFFVAAGAVLRVEEKWRAWFMTSLGVSVVILGYAFLQVIGAAETHQGTTRVTASFGNAIYLAIYLLFNTFIAGWLAFTEKQSWLKGCLLALAVLSSIFIFFTQTRGTILALIGALTLAALLTLFTAGTHGRRIAAGGLAMIVFLVGGFIAIRDSEMVRQNDLWNRIAHTSLADGSTRFTLWGMAFEGALERPIVGWGQEGFNYVFNKYYKPSLFAQEPWFDRAHNAFVDWLSAGGFPAFILYLSLFIVAIVTLWRSMLPRAERIALTCVIAGYAFHNLFVFDNLYSYVYFFAVLAVINAYDVPRPHKKEEPLIDPVIALPIASAVAIIVIFYVNISGFAVAAQLIKALSASDVMARVETFTVLAKEPSFAKQEIREQLVSFALQVVQSSGIPDQIKLQVATLAIEEMKKQVAQYPQDARQHLQLSLAYRVVGNLEGVLGEIDEAIKHSPKKQQFMLQKGITLLEVGRYREATEVLEQAYLLAPGFEESAKYAALANLVAGNQTRAEEILATHPTIRSAVEEIIRQLQGANAS